MSALGLRGGWIWTVGMFVAVVWLHAAPVRAADAWSMDAMTCQPWMVNGVDEGLTQYWDATGGYATTGSGDDDVWLFCPVWLPHQTIVDTMKIKTSFDMVDNQGRVDVWFYKHASISNGGSFTDLMGGACTAIADSTTAGRVTTCSFTALTICNYQDASAACNESSTGEVATYYVLARLRKIQNATPKFYGVWIGDPPSKESDAISLGGPVDCGDMLRAWEVGEAADDSADLPGMACLPPRDERTLLAPR